MKVILITGASTGIGKACALAAAQTEFVVYAGYRKGPMDIEIWPILSLRSFKYVDF